MEEDYKKSKINVEWIVVIIEKGKYLISWKIIFVDILSCSNL